MAPGLYNGKKTVWMRTLRPHTYEHQPKDVGDIYLAHDDPDNIANIESLGFAIRDTPPPMAVKPAEPKTVVIPPSTPVAPMTTQTVPSEQVKFSPTGRAKRKS